MHDACDILHTIAISVIPYDWKLGQVQQCIPCVTEVRPPSRHHWPPSRIFLPSCQAAIFLIGLAAKPPQL